MDSRKRLDRSFIIVAPMITLPISEQSRFFSSKVGIMTAMEDDMKIVARIMEVIIG